MYVTSGLGSVVSIATAYGWSGDRIPALRPTQPPVQWVLGVRCGWGDADPSPPSTAEVKNRVALYLYSP